MSSRVLLGRLCFVPLLFASLSAAPPSTPPAATDRSVAQIAQDRFELATKGYDIAQARFKKGRGAPSATCSHANTCSPATDLPSNSRPRSVAFLPDPTDSRHGARHSWSGESLFQLPR